jgi:hypothetical protein
MSAAKTIPLESHFEGVQCAQSTEQLHRVSLDDEAASPGLRVT